MRPWAAPRLSRCRLCPTTKRAGAKPTATETSSLMKGVEEVKYMRGEEDRVNARNQENLEKNSMQHRTKQHKEVPGPSANKTNIHTSESQQEFFRMLDEKIEKGRDYCSEEEDDVT
uniref:Zgc:92140 n=1 Tax=Cyprinus carpio carpio TaxID=630221 RepID=A0A8C0YMZ8_CYPCA